MVCDTMLGLFVRYKNADLGLWLKSKYKYIGLEVLSLQYVKSVIVEWAYMWSKQTLIR